eukprot:TRINITY_DN21179_c0_g1_i1.p1 TRINITY_DN21179_c0_g1~~TRINITY_DN21179_c0_g1_i1.p1  ORF type:complete len:854 (+),score=283.49 TRINITY_DN21179_c0_g1_i1:93-2564(+)
MPARLWSDADREYLHNVDAARLIDGLVSGLVEHKPEKAEIAQFLSKQLLGRAASAGGAEDPFARQGPMQAQSPPESPAAAPPKRRSSNRRRSTIREMHVLQNRPRAVLLDTDCGPPEDGGGEEIIALLWMASAVHQGQLEIAAVTTCAGDSPAEATFRCARSALLAAGLSEVPVGVERPAPATVVQRAPLPQQARMTGQGLPPCDLDASEAPSSAELIAAALRADPHRVTLLCFGGMNNLEAAERLDPGVLRLAREVVCMGGVDSIESATNRIAFIPREVASSVKAAVVYRERIAAFAKPGEDIERSVLHHLVTDLCEAIEQQCRLPLRMQPTRVVACAVAALYPQLLTFHRRPVKLPSSEREMEIASGHLVWVAEDCQWERAESAFVEDMQTLIETLPCEWTHETRPKPRMPKRKADGGGGDHSFPTPYPCPRPVLIDTDPGGDDVFALLWVAAGAEQGMVDIVAVTTGEGNVSARQTFAAARRVMLAVGLRDVTVARGVDAAVGAQDDFHGADGLGGLSEHLPPLDVDFDDAPIAPEVIVQCLTAQPHEVTVVCFGPLSNLAAADRMHPGVLRLAREVVAMGGAYEVPGNITSSAEFNVLHSPEAYVSTLEACDLVVLPLDVTTQLLVEQSHMDRIDAALIEDLSKTSPGTPTRVTTPPSANGRVPHPPSGGSTSPKAKAGTSGQLESRRRKLSYRLQEPDSRPLRSGREIFEFLQGLFEFQVMQTLNFKQTSGVTGMMVHDGACSLYLLHPEVFTFVRCYTMVECSGAHSRGRTLFDHRLAFTPQPNSWVALDVDPQRALAAFVNDLRAFFKALNRVAES